MHTCGVDFHDEGLQDGCVGCRALASNPTVQMDDRLLIHTIDLAVSRERLDRCRSDNEALASALVLTVLERAGKILSTSPAAVTDYLASRWRVPVHLDKPAGRP